MLFSSKSITVSHYFSTYQSSEITKLGYYIGIYRIRKRSNNNSSKSSLINHSCEIKIDYEAPQICKILQLYDFFNFGTE